MKTCTNLILLLLFLFVIKATALQAQVFNSEIIEDISEITIENNKLIDSRSRIIQINNRMGDNDSEIEIVYQKDNKISFGDIWLEDSTGKQIRKLSKKDIKERSYITNSSLYRDLYTKYFELKHNQYPYRIVYSYKIESNKFIDICSMDLNRYSDPVKSGKIIIKHSIENPIKTRFENFRDYAVDTLENTITHEWRYTYTPAKTRQIHQNINNSQAPKLTASPSEFKFGVKGQNQGWDSFGNWIYRLNLNRDILPESEISKIKSIIANIDNKKEKIRALYHYLQDNTRYINVSTKYGGIQTHPAEYVAINKYGDCKALSNYMQAMLKVVGIESFYTLIFSDDQVQDLDNDFSYNGFNHVILTVPMENDTIILECTSKNDPMGYIHTNIQGRKALMVKENGSKLINIPSLDLNDVLCSRNIKIELGDDNAAEVKIQTVERGEDYEIINSYKNYASKNQLESFIRNRVLNSAFELTDYRIEEENRDSSLIKVEISCQYNKAYKKYGKNIMLSPIPFYLPKFESPENRVSDVQIDYPIHYKDSITYSLKDEIGKHSEDINLSSPWGDSYKVSFKINDKELVVTKELIINAQRIPLESYEEFYNFIKQVSDTEKSNIYLETL